jgi:DNA-binding transcriptional ArsR family regulator
MKKHLTILRGLADKTRLRIIQMLFSGPHCVEEITARLKMSQPRVSRHLRILRESDLVETRRERRRIYYSLGGGEEPAVAEILRFLEEWLAGRSGTDEPARPRPEKPAREPDELPAPSVGELEDFLL